MTIVETYAEAKYITNTCPECGQRAQYRVRFKYADEGKRLCVRCASTVKQIEMRNSRQDRVTNARNALRSELRGMFEGYTGYAIDELINKFDEYFDARAEAAE